MTAQWETVIEWGPGLVVQATLILTVAWLWTTAARQASAATRHLVWMAALVATLVLPVRWLMAPSWGLVPINWSRATVDATVDREAAKAAIQWGLTGNRPSGASILLAVAAPVEAVVAPEKSGLAMPTTQDAAAGWPLSLNDGSLAALIAGIWLAGVVLAGLPILLGMGQLWRRRSGAEPFPELLAGLLERTAREVGIGRPVTGLLTGDPVIPMTWGVIHPVILLPMDAVEWSPARLRMVLLHELGHIRRADCLTQMLALVTRAVYWFHPLAWLAVQRVRREQEAASDDLVLRAGVVGADYAGELLTVTARLPQSRLEAGVALAMSRCSRIEQRLRAILREDVNRRPASRAQLSAVVVLFSGSVLACVAGRDAVRADDTQPAANAVTSEAASKAGATATTDPTAPKSDTAKPAENAAAEPSAEKAATPPGAADKPPVPAPPVTVEADAETDYRIIRNLIEVISTHSAQPAARITLRNAAIHGVLESLGDQYTTVVTPDVVKELHGAIDSKLVGIGATLHLKEQAVTVLTVIPNSPAAKAGIRSGDQIRTVDGTKTVSIDETARRIRGKEGTEVVLSIAGPGETPRTVTIRRAAVTIPTVRGIGWSPESGWRHLLDREAGIGYVAISSFANRTAEEFEKVVAGLKKDGMRGLVIDLRRNPGGVLQEAIRIGQLFLSESEFVRILGRDAQQQEVLKTGPNAAYADLPLIVVVDQTTGSAAEILAAALQENKRAVIVGERTVGKGSIQQILPIAENNMVRLTTHFIATPSGRLLNRNPEAKQWGVDPDDGLYFPRTVDERQKWEATLNSIASGELKLPERLSEAEITERLADKPLAGAVTALKGRITTGEFTKSGRPLSEQQTQLDTVEVLRKRRDELRREVERLNQELGEKP